MKTLELNQMELLIAGEKCAYQGLGDSLTGAGYIFAFAGAWTGGGAVIGVSLLAAGWALDKMGC